VASKTCQQRQFGSPFNFWAFMNWRERIHNALLILRLHVNSHGSVLINEVPGNLAPSTHIGSFRKELAAAQMRKSQEGP
jgi:hypothetical protein